MNLETIDQLLTDWRTKLDIASQNLLDLQSFPTYQRLAGEAGFPQPHLTGHTAAQVQPAIEAMNGLFQHFDLLSQTLQRAQTLRQQITGRRNSEAKLSEIAQILTGESIQLPWVQIPLAQRQLLSAAQGENRVKPIDLMLAMVKSFEGARDAVLAVDRAWQRLEPQLLATFQEIRTLQQQAQALDLAQLTELTQAEQSLATLHDRVSCDPLGVQDDFETTIAPLIAQAQTRIIQLQQQRQQIVTGIQQTAQQMQVLQARHQEALALYTEAIEKIQDTTSLHPPLSPDSLTALMTWQTTLDRKLQEGILQPLQVGLANWQAKYQDALTLTESAIATATQALNLRQELRGRLHALQAKAQAKGRIEDPKLVTLAAQSQTILFSRPSDLTQANQLLIQYEQQLNRPDRAS